MPEVEFEKVFEINLGPHFIGNCNLELDEFWRIMGKVTVHNTTPTTLNIDVGCNGRSIHIKIREKR